MKALSLGLVKGMYVYVFPSICIMFVMLTTWYRGDGAFLDKLCSQGMLSSNEAFGLFC